MLPGSGHRCFSLLGTLALVLAAAVPAGISTGVAQAAGPAPIDPYRTTVTLTAPGEVAVLGVAGSLAAGNSIAVTNVSNGAQASAPRAADGSFALQISGSRGHQLRLVAGDGAGNDSAPIDLYVGALNIKNPYTAGGHWFVGQGHMHTTESDGSNAPADMEAAYKDRGYDFVISTDHRGVCPDFTADGDGMTPDPDNSASGKDLLWISSSEMSDCNVHLNAWGTSTPVPMSDLTSTQTLIDSVRARGGIAAANHPLNMTPGYAWDWHTEINPLKRYSLIEGFNQDARHLAHAIDLADEFQQVWWIGADDCHNLYASNFDTYAIVVQTDSPVMSPGDLLAAADAGRLYVRQTLGGPEIQGVSVAGNRITLTLKNIGTGAYTVTWKQRGDAVVRTSAGVTTQSSYTVLGGEGYVRAEVLRTADGKRAYTQPLFVGNAADLAVAASAAALTDNDGGTVWDAGASTGSFVVDAGAVRTLNAIRIDWDGAGGRRFNYRIETSVTGEFTGEEEEVVRTTYSNRLANTLDFFDEQARYVRVVITGQSAGPAATARVREVQLHDSSPGRTQLYVNNETGSDANDSGLGNAPWRTAGYAATRVRPRDTLNFVRTQVPYPGNMLLSRQQSGKNSGATVEYRGDALLKTPIDATGSEFGVRLEDTQYLEMTHFDIHSAEGRNVWLQDTRTGTSLRYNVIRNTTSDGVLGSGTFSLAYNLIYDNAAKGVIVQGDGTNAQFYNNVIAGNAGGGLLLASSGAFSATIRNNIISGNGSFALARGWNGSVLDSHNCVSGAYWGFFQRSGNVDGDPQLWNPAGGELTLKSSSPCIDAGMDLNFNSDFLGYGIFDEPSRPNTGSPGSYSRTYVDMGAYEFGSPCPDCPSCHD